MWAAFGFIAFLSESLFTLWHANTDCDVNVLLATNHSYLSQCDPSFMIKTSLHFVAIDSLLQVMLAHGSAHNQQ